MYYRRGISALLAASLLLTTPVTALAAGPQQQTSVRGGISATVRIDYAQSLAALGKHKVQAELLQGGSSLGIVPLDSQQETQLSGGYPVAVALRNADGGDLGGGVWPGYIDLKVAQLPQGTYTLRFTGEGYCTYEQQIELSGYAQHVILGTGDQTFTLGDVNGDNQVDEADRTALSAALGSTDDRYDLNGDGVVDIIDLSYIGRHLKAEGEAQVLDTALLAPPLQAEEMDRALTAAGIQVVSAANDQAASLADVIAQNQPVVVRSSADKIDLPIAFSGSVEMQQLELATPVGAGEIASGEVTVAYEDGSTETIAFDQNMPEGLHATGRTPGVSVVKIDLGKRVPVKKITISVNMTESGYVAIESIQFLKDIVPENPVQLYNRVRGLQAVEGDEKVTLKWGELPNVSGYKVEYWEDGSADKQERTVAVSTAEITGLENLTQYFFTVTPVDGSWQGMPSDPISATPRPASAPPAPDMLVITEQDASLALSWKKTEGATYYEIYYAEQGSTSFTQFGQQQAGTSAVITGLVGGTTYQVYVVAGNDIGKSAPSKISTGTPKVVLYERPAGIPARGVLDHTVIDSIRLEVPNSYSGREHAGTGFQPAWMADGDYSTHWTSQSYGDGNFTLSKKVIATFKEPQDLSSVIWVPRLDGSYRSNLRVYTVTVWREGDDLNGAGTMLVPDPARGGSSSAVTWKSVKGNPSATGFAVLPFEPVTGVTQIAVTIEQVGYSAVSLSELLFLQYDPANDLQAQIDALFADGLHTTLAAGVNEAQIDALEARLNSDEREYYLYPTVMADELALAREMLTGQSSGVLLDGIASRSTAADQQKYGQSGSDLQPLGVAAKAGDQVVVYVSGIPDGERVMAYATQYNAEASAWKAELGRLENGRNVLTVPRIGGQNTPRGGSLYLSYDGAAPEGIKLHVRGATDIPVLELGGWYKMDEDARRAAISAYVDELAAYTAKIGANGRETNCLNVTEISMPTVLLSIPATSVQDNSGQTSAERVETLYQNTLAWEQLMHIANTTQGIDNTLEKGDMQSRQNVRYMQMFAGAFMYAAGSHIGIGFGSCGGMVVGKPVETMEAGATANRLFGWGIAHEVGHNMDKLGKAEITNNLYALMIQTYDGQQNTLPSRLESGYDQIFTRVAEAQPGMSNNVFVQLGLYWQLHLAYDEADKPLDFYNRFFKLWKSGAVTAESSDDRFALVAAETADADLTEFLTRWGMRLSEETKQKLAAYPVESRAIWYLNDQSRRDRLANVQPASGSLTADAVLTGDNQIEVTIAPSITGNVQGYEIRRGGKSIAFTSETTYTDVISSANHRTYTYEVVAYDTLGNQIASADTAEVRVAYDKTVPADTYRLTREGTTVTLTLQEETAVSGIKLSGVDRPTSGDFTVTVTDGEGVEHTARAGAFDQGNQAVDDQDSYLTYFNKPGTTSVDTRIWTYDAKVVTITGVPESMEASAIALISYAGDDVALLEEGGVGRLSAEYRYGDGADDVIPAGTLIITGTYRGDPVYGTIKVKGDFTKTSVDGETTSEQRYLDGYTLLLAEIPEDQQVSDISDGLFIFVPNVQHEAELQGETHCDGENLLPSRIKAEFSRTDDPTSPDSQRVTAETLWTHTPGGHELPEIVLEVSE